MTHHEKTFFDVEIEVNLPCGSSQQQQQNMRRMFSKI
jgi:hypothetical protein